MNMTKQNETKKDYIQKDYILTQEQELDDFLLDEEWDDDESGRACLNTCNYEDDIDGWMGGI